MYGEIQLNVFLHVSLSVTFYRILGLNTRLISHDSFILCILATAMSLDTFGAYCVFYEYKYVPRKLKIK